jgi:hypothetical protein
MSLERVGVRLFIARTHKKKKPYNTRHIGYAIPDI